MEIEKKWIVDKTKFDEVIKHNIGSRKIEQHYMNSAVEEWIIRIRSTKDGKYLTLKSKGLLSREELEVEIDDSQFKMMKEHALTSLKKTRYLVPHPFNYKMYICEVDVYDDYDFITCEIEFATEEEANKFKMPDWCLRDVTYDESFKNNNLAKMDFAKKFKESRLFKDK